MINTLPVFACGGTRWGLLTPVFVVMAAPLALITGATLFCRWLDDVAIDVETKRTRWQIDCGNRGICYRCDSVLRNSTGPCLTCGAPRRIESSLLPKVQLRR